MNRVIVAKRFVADAWDEITAHGIGRRDWLIERCNKARVELMNSADNFQHRVPIMELFYCVEAINRRNVTAALHELKTVEETLDLMLEQESAEAVVDRLLASVYPWEGR